MNAIYRFGDPVEIVRYTSDPDVGLVALIRTADDPPRIRHARSMLRKAEKRETS